MKKFLIIAGLIFAAGTAFAMSDVYVSGTWRIKTTVTVETPEGIKTGSAVREISNSASSISLGWPHATNAPDISGEAVVVDLGERGTLFSLISDGTDYEMYQVFPTPGIPETSLEGIKYYNKTLKPGMKGELDPDKRPGYPKMVTFTDMGDPKSVTLVQGYWLNPETQESVVEDNFEELFGEGVRLKSVELEVTKEPVTWGVVDEWLPAGSEKLNLTYNYFSWGKQQ